MLFSPKKMLISKNFTQGDFNAEGVIMHSTANQGATAMNHYTFWNRDYVGASAHIVSDWYEILQLVDFNNRAFHAGKTANGKFIGWEMCEPPKGNWELFNLMYKLTVDGLAKLLIDRNWNTKAHVWSHAWASNTFKETDHQDPYAFLQQYSRSWNQFLSDVDVRMGQLKNIPKSYFIETNYLPSDQWGVEIISILNKYFNDIPKDRIWMKHDTKGQWIITQWYNKDACDKLAQKLKQDSLLWKITEC